MSKLRKNNFKIYSELTVKSIDAIKSSNGDERLRLTGVASTTSKDFYGETVSKECIESMKQQAKRLNIHADHTFGLFDGVIGAVKDVLDSNDDTLEIKFDIRKKYTEELQDILETGINLGLSIDGNVGDYNMETSQIKEIKLIEISLTALPANWDTFGTVTTAKGLVKSNCVTGACYQVLKNLKSDNMAEDNNKQESTGISKDEAVDLFNELMASKEDEIKASVLDSIKTDMEKIIEDKIEDTIKDEGGDGNNKSSDGGDNNVEGAEKSISEAFNEFKEDVLKSLEEQQTKIAEEVVLKSVKSRNPEPTPKPSNTDGNEPTKKSYTNEEILKNLKQKHARESIFNIATE